MKKVIKNIITTIAILYMIISLTVLTYNYLVNTDLQEIYNSEYIHLHNNNSLENKQMANEFNISYIKTKLAEIGGSLDIINMMYKCLVISIVLGAIIGAIISLKEDSKVKYISYFVLGNVIYNIITTISTQMIYAKSSYKVDILEDFIRNFKSTLVIYIIDYTIFTIVRIFINKLKVDKLNKELINKERSDENVENN